MFVFYILHVLIFCYMITCKKVHIRSKTHHHFAHRMPKPWIQRKQPRVELRCPVRKVLGRLSSFQQLMVGTRVVLPGCEHDDVRMFSEFGWKAERFFTYIYHPWN